MHRTKTGRKEETLSGELDVGKPQTQKHVKKGTLLGGPKLYDAINRETRQRMMKWRRCVNKSKKFYLGIVIGKAILWDCLSLRLC